MIRIKMLLLLAMGLPLALCAQDILVRFETTKGNILVKLYGETPRHRDMFLKAIRKGWYKDAEFNRVIASFVSQGGDLDDTILNREKRMAAARGLMPGALAKRLPAEIRLDLIHKKGALGAGRDDNKEKASYFRQIYFVEGRVQTDAQLDAVEQRKGIRFSVSQREIYKTLGGTPGLDGDYTVFGEIVSGMEVAEAINSVPVDKDDVPLQSVKFKVLRVRGKIYGTPEIN